VVRTGRRCLQWRPAGRGASPEYPCVSRLTTPPWPGPARHCQPAGRSRRASLGSLRSSTTRTSGGPVTFTVRAQDASGLYVRVTSQCNGNPDTPYGQVENLAGRGYPQSLARVSGHASSHGPAGSRSTTTRRRRVRHINRQRCVRARSPHSGPHIGRYGASSTASQPTGLSAYPEVLRVTGDGWPWRLNLAPPVWERRDGILMPA
jgi:hypothetical protein